MWRENDIILESMEFPEPVIHLSVEPKSKADQDKMTQALVKLQEEDQHSMHTQMKKLDKLSSVVWVNYT